MFIALALAAFGLLGTGAVILSSSGDSYTTSSSSTNSLNTLESNNSQNKETSGSFSSSSSSAAGNRLADRVKEDKNSCTTDKAFQSQSSAGSRNPNPQPNPVDNEEQPQVNNEEHAHVGNAAQPQVDMEELTEQVKQRLEDKSENFSERLDTLIDRWVRSPEPVDADTKRQLFGLESFNVNVRGNEQREVSGGSTLFVLSDIANYYSELVEFMEQHKQDVSQETLDAFSRVTSSLNKSLNSVDDLPDAIVCMFVSCAYRKEDLQAQPEFDTYKTKSPELEQILTDTNLAVIELMTTISAEDVADEKTKDATQQLLNNVSLLSSLVTKYRQHVGEVRAEERPGQISERDLKLSTIRDLFDENGQHYVFPVPPEIPTNEDRINAWRRMFAKCLGATTKVQVTDENNPGEKKEEIVSVLFSEEAKKLLEDARDGRSVEFVKRKLKIMLATHPDKNPSKLPENPTDKDVEKYENDKIRYNVASQEVVGLIERAKSLAELGYLPDGYDYAELNNVVPPEDPQPIPPRPNPDPNPQPNPQPNPVAEQSAEVVEAGNQLQQLANGDGNLLAYVNNVTEAIVAITNNMATNNQSLMEKITTILDGGGLIALFGRANVADCVRIFPFDENGVPVERVEITQVKNTLSRVFKKWLGDDLSSIFVTNNTKPDFYFELLRTACVLKSFSGTIEGIADNTNNRKLADLAGVVAGIGDGSVQLICASVLLVSARDEADRVRFDENKMNQLLMQKGASLVAIRGGFTAFRDWYRTLRPEQRSDRYKVLRSVFPRDA